MYVDNADCGARGFVLAWQIANILGWRVEEVDAAIVRGELQAQRSELGARFWAVSCDEADHFIAANRYHYLAA